MGPRSDAWAFRKLPEYQSLKKLGITLGWPLEIDSSGRIAEFSIDSLRWSDGESRPTLPASDVLLQNLSFRITMEEDAGGTLSGFRNLVLDDIRFENR
ncbi:MAG: hypothetical protein H6686_01275 [Fibrobacteria bacterium]|nr:hypothetical protein [Fibrobacteria bacterium]